MNAKNIIRKAVPINILMLSIFIAAFVIMFVKDKKRWIYLMNMNGCR